MTGQLGPFSLKELDTSARRSGFPSHRAAMTQYSAQRYADMENADIRVARFSAYRDACEWCRAIDGRRVTRSSPLWSTLRPPFHDGCRCVAEPIVSIDREERADDDWAAWLAAHPPLE
ncbi:MAG: hypothetical protein ACYDCK_01490 [Thermoplasmatota archaeon]